MCFTKDILKDIKSLRGEVTIGDGKTLKVKGIGDVLASVITNGRIVEFQLENMLYVPDLTANLISVSQATKNGEHCIGNVRR
jgi:hypothetical protein